MEPLNKKYDSHVDKSIIFKTLKVNRPGAYPRGRPGEQAPIKTEQLKFRWQYVVFIIILPS